MAVWVRYVDKCLYINTTLETNIFHICFLMPISSKRHNRSPGMSQCFLCACTNCQRQLMIIVCQGFINNQQGCKTFPELCSPAVLIWQFLFVCQYQLFILLVPRKNCMQALKKPFRAGVWRSSSSVWQERCVKCRSECCLNLEEAKRLSP